jgi:hypothetical protein
MDFFNIKKALIYTFNVYKHNRWTIRTALAAFKGNIYLKHKCSRIVLPHP